MMDCKWCGTKIKENYIQIYPEILHECECGTVIDSGGNDRTDEYYKNNTDGMK